MRCYRCRKEVTSLVHECMAHSRLERLPEEEQIFVTEYLDLIHCTGPEDVFNDQGHAIICMDCYCEAIRKYRLEGRKFFSVAHDEEIGTLQDVIDTLTGNFGDEMYDQGMIYTEGWYKSELDMVFHTLGMLDSFEYKPQLSLADLEYIFNAVFIWMDSCGKETIADIYDM